MIAFGSVISRPEAYGLYAGAGIELAREPDSEVFVISAVGPVARGCNLLLDTAGAREDLEALVVLHPHAQIDDPAFCQKVRDALADPDVALVGAAGGSGVQTLAWWDGEISAGPITHRFDDHGGGRMPAYAWTTTAPAPAEVDAIDGFLMVLSPWAVRTLRFDESLTLGHGFDIDFCLQVRQAGRKIVTADLRTVHHHSLELFEDKEKWVEAHIQLAEKWDAAPGQGEPADWKQRARRAEAESEAARALTYGLELGSDARLLGLERELEEMLSSRSWRLTAPLRAANAALRRRRR
jgi:hypothetical protein